MRHIDNAQNAGVQHLDLAPTDKNRAALVVLADAVARLRYGAVHLTVHDGRVVQLDVTERQRFT